MKRKPGENFRDRALAFIDKLDDLEIAARSYVANPTGYGRMELANKAMKFTAAARTLARNRKDR